LGTAYYNLLALLVKQSALRRFSIEDEDDGFTTFARISKETT
jgi:hypothetical protein